MKNSTLQILPYVYKGETRYNVYGQSILIKKRNQNWLEAYVPFNKKPWVESVKSIEAAQWQDKACCWLLPYVKKTFYHLRQTVKLSNVCFDFKIEATIPDQFSVATDKKTASNPDLKSRYNQLPAMHKEVLIKVESHMLLRRYSYTTIKNYRHRLIALFYFFKNIHPENIYPEHVQRFLLDQLQTKKPSSSAQNQVINAYKLYAEKILKRPKAFIEIPRPKKIRKLPGVLSSKEVLRLIRATANLKHQLALMLVYASGLRGSELTGLLLSDLQVDRRAIHIKAAKGKKDRYVVLAESAIPYLQKYLEEYQPVRWLFEGQYGGKYSIRSLQNVFHRALEKSGIDAYATLHTLRHSYATHCLENGHNLKSVQQALGHKSLKTTEIYLHVTSDALRKLQSPLDKMQLS